MAKHSVFIMRTKGFVTVNDGQMNHSGERPVDHAFANNVEKTLRAEGYRYYSSDNDTSTVLYEKDGSDE